jgi:hypothetical protein
MKVVLVDCLIYQGLLCYQERRAVGSPDRDEPITTRMKRAHWTIMHTDYRRPLGTFATTISAVVGLHFYRAV